MALAVPIIPAPITAFVKLKVTLNTVPSPSAGTGLVIERDDEEECRGCSLVLIVSCWL